MTRICAVLLVAGLLAGGCTGTDRPAVAPSPPRSAGPVSPAPPPSAVVHEVRCRDAISNEPPLAGLEMVLGVVTLPTRRLLEAHPGGEPGWLFAKHGIQVRADAAVDLSVVGEAAEHTRISWGNPGPHVSRLRFPGCPTDTGWLAYAGGYAVDAPACVPLAIRYAGREAQVRIGVGVRCP